MAQKQFKWKIFSRVILTQVLIVLLALGGAGVAARQFFKRQFLSQSSAHLRSTLSGMVASLPANVDELWCISRAGDTFYRVTVISKDGRVLCDSDHNPNDMENHADRPEIREAIATGYGETMRASKTLKQDLLYAALHVKERDLVLREAIPMEHLNAMLSVFDRTLLGFLILIAIVLTGVATWSIRRLVFPLGRLYIKAQRVLEHGEEDDYSDASRDYGELSDLEDSLDDIRRDLQAKAESLSLEREEQATLMSAISDAILAIDQDGAPLFYNSRFMLLFGGKEMATRNLRLWELFRDPEVLEAFRAALKEGKAGAVKAIPLEIEGGRRFFSVSVSPLRRSTENVYGAVGIFHDVSDLKRAEQIRIDFVANVSHELRTPLTAIKGYTDTLIQDVGGGRPADKEYLEIIARNTNRLMSLINDLLDLSSLESNVDDFQKSEISTEEFTSRLINHIRGGIEAKKQDLKVNVQAPIVLADSRRLEQVFINLLDNAHKYTPVGGSISVSWTSDEHGDVVLRIHNSGPAIPPEHHARLFERFYRVDKARSRELGGTGLGLAIVKHIMQRHEGNVWVESTSGQGATFICRFPKGHA